MLEQRKGMTVDGTVYSDPDFTARLEEYHASAAGAHRGTPKIDGSCPRADVWRSRRCRTYRFPSPSRAGPDAWYA